MSGLAEILIRLGHQVSGSDASDSETLARLEQMGAKVYRGHHEQNVSQEKPDVVVFSSAINPSNPEIAAAEELEIPLIRRAEMLAELMRLKRGLAVAGSHGKTTTTGMISQILTHAGLDPTVVIGGKFDAIGSTNAALGAGAWMVAEADESDGSFLKLSPEVAVVTNIDKEHLDHFKNLENCKNAFGEFLDRLPFYGRAILCSDCSHLRSVGRELRKPKIWYGLDAQFSPDFLVKIISEGTKNTFGIFTKKSSYQTSIGQLELKIPGRHNILNAAASLLAALELEISFDVAAEALKKFGGVRRRFEFKGKISNSIDIIEDYAHHPTEIIATMSAAKSYFQGKPLWVAFQPHRFSRTRDSWAEFKNVFVGAEKIWTLPIYAASEPREPWTAEFDGGNFASHVGSIPANSLSELTEKIAKAFELTPPRDLPAALLVLGAGDIPKIIPQLLG